MTLRLKLILIGEGHLMHFYYYMYIEVSGILYRVKMIKKTVDYDSRIQYPLFFFNLYTNRRGKKILGECSIISKIVLFEMNSGEY